MCVFISYRILHMGGIGYGLNHPITGVDMASLIEDVVAGKVDNVSEETINALFLELDIDLSNIEELEGMSISQNPNVLNLYDSIISKMRADEDIGMAA